MRILSLNVRGLGGSAKQKSLRNLFLTLSPDVVLFQETMTSTNFVLGGNFVHLTLLVSRVAYSLDGTLKCLDVKLIIR